jgi:HPt (histidine-containing phosphotransfer) domain-containing protein
VAGVIDAKMWDSLKALEQAGEPGFLRGVVAQFLETSPARLRAIHKAAAARDFAALEREAHTLKGSAGILGAQRMAECCERLESHARERRGADEAALVSLEREWEAARAELLAELRKQP